MTTGRAGKMVGVDGERLEGRRVDDVEWLRPSSQLAAMRRAEVFTATAVTALAAASALWAWASALSGVVAFALVVALGVVSAVLVQRRVRSWGYAERKDDLLVRHGLLVSRLSVVPYGRMQFIDVTAGPVERLFGIVTVKLHTAAAASDARIPGLSEETGGRLRDRLASLGEAQASGL
jgi:membrane protein YdbS with pleckstrin-like domain